MDGMPNHRDKAVFSNLFSVVWTGYNLCPRMLDFVPRERLVHVLVHFILMSPFRAIFGLALEINPKLLLKSFYQQ